MSEDDKSDFETARLLGKMEAGIERQGQQVDRIESTLTILDGTLTSLGSKLSDMHSRVVSLEQAAQARPRHNSLTSEHVEYAMEQANQKQSESIRVGILQANEPVLEATHQQTRVVKDQTKTLARAQAFGTLAMAVILAAWQYFTSHH